LGSRAGWNVAVRLRGAGPMAEWCAAAYPRHCERSEAIHGTAQRKNGLLRRFAPRNDEYVDTVSPSRGALRPSFSINRSPSNQESAGNAGCLLHPRSRVQCARGSAHTSIQVQPEQPGIPCAVGLRLIPRSPWRRIPFASIAGGLKMLANPVGFATSPPA